MEMQDYSFSHTAYQLIRLAEIYGIRHAVLSPGSRNAPIIHELARSEQIRLHSIVDERAAAFFALGIADRLQEAVMLCCSSGTATLNYAPAMAEAYYRHIPLLAVTADRPPELIDQLENQAIRQPGIYRNFCDYSFNLHCNPDSKTEIQQNLDWMHQAFIQIQKDLSGPVHINVPLREPLYKKQERPVFKERRRAEPSSPSLQQSEISALTALWKERKNKMILAGFAAADATLNIELDKLLEKDQIVLMHDHISNIQATGIQLVDAVIQNQQLRKPDLVLSFGGGMISKKLKQYLREIPGLQHIHIGPQSNKIDPFGKWAMQLNCKPIEVIKYLNRELADKVPNELGASWLKYQEQLRLKTEAQLKTEVWSDLVALDKCLKELPENAQVFHGNSSPVRNAQLLYLNRPDIRHFANRGTSGIDGQSSTASGIATVSDELSICFSGDLSFLYDSNALWNAQLSRNLRYVVFNNGGGNIFDLIPGPSDVGQYENYIATRHRMNLEHLCLQFGLAYYSVENLADLERVLKYFYTTEGNAAVLEIKTNPSINRQVFQNYFKATQAI